MKTQRLSRFAAPFVAILWLSLAGCSTSRMVTVPSVNKDSRVAVVVIHHTSGNFGSSLTTLTEPSSYPVSSHYLVPEPGDGSYDRKDLRLYSLVPEDERAWHAGTSYWKELTRLNNLSIGIEVVNQTYCHEPENAPPPSGSDWAPESFCFYPDYPESQLALLVDLMRGIMQRHPDVKPTHIVGHSDIAPQRKIDPGPRFPWQRLYRLGFGAWPDDDTVAAWWERFRLAPPDLATVQRALHAYGYQIELTGEDDLQSRNVLRAFQMHFLPWQVSGKNSVETAAVLYALIDKYYPGELQALLPAPAADLP